MRCSVMVVMPNGLNADRFWAECRKQEGEGSRNESVSVAKKTKCVWSCSWTSVLGSFGTYFVIRIHNNTWGLNHQGPRTTRETKPVCSPDNILNRRGRLSCQRFLEPRRHHSRLKAMLRGRWRNCSVRGCERLDQLSADGKTGCRSFNGQQSDEKAAMFGAWIREWHGQ